ncbi:hypothetical protein [Streptomyces sp. ADMS]|uniref:hypothetical protein n=1 Tax=Streptomyces sp. ADMS TaxID=3071415 RepID=UPI0039930D60
MRCRTGCAWPACCSRAGIGCGDLFSEFSIVIAGLAVTAGIESDLGPLATAYVLILVVAGPLTARWTEPLAARVGAWRARPSPQATASPDGGAHGRRRLTTWEATPPCGGWLRRFRNCLVPLGG